MDARATRGFGGAFGASRGRWFRRAEARGADSSPSRAPPDGESAARGFAPGGVLGAAPGGKHSRRASRRLARPARLRPVAARRRGSSAESRGSRRRTRRAAAPAPRRPATPRAPRLSPRRFPEPHPTRPRQGVAHDVGVVAHASLCLLLRVARAITVRVTRLDHAARDAREAGGRGRGDGRATPPSPSAREEPPSPTSSRIRGARLADAHARAAETEKTETETEQERRGAGAGGALPPARTRSFARTRSTRSRSTPSSRGATPSRRRRWTREVPPGRLRVAARIPAPDAARRRATASSPREGATARPSPT